MREVWEASREQGLSQRTLERAKAELKIRSGRLGKDGQHVTYWLLRNQEMPGPDTEEGDQYSLEPWLAPLREQFPDPGPLDDM